MRDEDELGVAPHLLEHFLKADHVGLIKGGIDLVEQAERTGSYFEDGKHEGNCGHGFLTTGKQGEILHTFAHGVGADLDS